MRVKPPSSPTTRASPSPFLSSPQPSPRRTLDPPLHSGTDTSPSPSSASDDPTDLDDSWYPVTVSSTGGNGNDDDEQSSTFGSSLSGSVGHLSSDTGDENKDRWEVSTDEGSLSGEVEHVERHLDNDDNDNAKDSDYEHVTDGASSLLGGDSYIDAEATGTDMHTSLDTLGAGSAASSQIRLIFPNPNPESSFCSLTSSDRTPGGSMGNLLRVPEVGEHQITPSRWSDGSRASQLWSPGPRVKSMLEDTEYQMLSSQEHNKPPANSATDEKTPARLPDAPAAALTAISKEMRKSDVIEPDMHDRVPNDRLAEFRRAGKKWSVRMSVVALASVLLSLALYRPSGPLVLPDQMEVTTIAVPPASGKPFSIWDHLPLSSMAEVISAEPSASTRLADLNLIRNALSLSTRSVAISPADPVTTSQHNKAPSRVDDVIKPNGGSTACCSLSIRNSDVALTPVVNPSVWQKTLNMMRNASQPIKNATSAEECKCSFKDIVFSDIKSAWSYTLSTFSHADLIHFIHQQVQQAILKEFHGLCVVANEIRRTAAELSKVAADHASNMTQYAVGHARAGISYAQHRLPLLFHSLRLHNPRLRVRMPPVVLNANAARQAAGQAKRGLDTIVHITEETAHQAQEKGAESLKRARRGLDRLVTEAKQLKENKSRQPEAEHMTVRLEKVRVRRGRGGERRYGGSWMRKGHGHDESKADGKDGQGQKRGADIPPRPVEPSRRRKLLDMVHHAVLPLVI